MNHQNIIAIETSDGTVNAIRMHNGAVLSWLDAEWEFVGQERWSLVFRTRGWRVFEDSEDWQAAQELELKFEAAQIPEVLPMLMDLKPITLEDALKVWPWAQVVGELEVLAA
jgi:hypothetical protein